MESKLLEYYNRELAYLREMGAEFAERYPKVAGRLGMRGIEVADPYTERLMEGFAFLTSRVQMKMDAEFPRFSQRLLEMIAPNYLAPTPSMAIAEIQPDSTRGDLSNGFKVPRGTMMDSLALKKTAQEFDKALVEAKPYQATGSTQTATEGKKESAGAYRHLLTGVSYMLPMVVAGGLCIALSFAFGITAFKEEGTLAAALMQIGGGSAFALMVPVLAGFIAFSIADRPGLTPGLIGGMLAVSTGSGFIGGIIAGFLAGYVAKLISSKLKLPQSMEALKPILIIPLISSLVVGLAMIYLIGKPVAGILAGLTHWLQTMGTANAVLLGAILGGMMCTDMGGPVNKAAYAFGVGLLSTQTYAPMAAIMAAGMVPPLAMGIATLVARNKFDKGQREGGKAALVLGLCFISEGAIPFAARDPMRVLPCCIVGGAVTGAISMAVGAKLMAPHGGLFVLLIPGAITPVLGYLLAIVAGTLVAGLAYAVLKRPEAQTAEVEKAA